MPQLKVDLTMNDSNFKSTLNQDKEAVNDFAQKVSKGGDDLQKFVEKMSQSGSKTSDYRRKLMELTRQLQDMMVNYRSLSDEEKKTAEGMKLAQKIDELKQKAGELKDTMLDANAQIKFFASDTPNLDAFTDGLDIAKNSMQAFIGITSLFGEEGEDYAKVLTMLASVEATFNAVKAVANKLQQEGSVIQKIVTLQDKAQAAAATLNATAHTGLASSLGLATVAQKALNAVAMANPYVLLATAIVAVVSAVTAWCVSEAKAERQAKLMNDQLERQHKMFQQIEEDIQFNMDIMNAEGKTRKEVLQYALQQYKKEHVLAQQKLEDAKKLVKVGKMSVEQYNKVREQEQKAYNNVKKTNNEILLEEIRERTAAEDKKRKSVEDNLKKTSDARKKAHDEEEERLRQEQEWNKQNPEGSLNRMNAEVQKLQEAQNKLNVTTEEGKLQWKSYQEQIEKINAGQEQLARDLSLVSDSEKEVKKFYQNVTDGAYNSAQEVSALNSLMDKLQRRMQYFGEKKDWKNVEKFQDMLDELNNHRKNKIETVLSGVGLNWNSIEELDDYIKTLQDELNDTWDPSKAEEYFAAIRKYTQRKLYLEAEVKLNMGDLKTSKEWKEVEEEFKQKVKETSESIKKDAWQMATAIYGTTTSIIDSFQQLSQSWDDMTPYEKFANICDLIISSVNSLSSIIETINQIAEAQRQMTAASQAATAASQAATAAQQVEQASNATTAASNTAVAVTEATKSGSKLPFPANIAAIAIGVAAVVSAIAMIAALSSKAKKFASGGIVQGMSSVGDQQLAAVNSGEIIMNKNQQSRLWNFLNGKGGMNVQKQTFEDVVFRIDGDTLVAALKNHDRIKRKR